MLGCSLVVVQVSFLQNTVAIVIVEVVVGKAIDVIVAIIVLVIVIVVITSQ